MASFNSNNALFLCFLVAISAFMAPPSFVEAQIPGFASLIDMSGTVYCAPRVNVSSDGSTVPRNVTPFANAAMIMRCANKTMGNTTTDASGNFRMVVNTIPAITSIFSSLQPGSGSTCNLIVLSTCNASLPPSGNISIISPVRIPFLGRLLVKSIF